MKTEGFDIRWAEFEILKCMSNDKFFAKKIAYTTAAIIFESNSDSMMMATNQFQKVIYFDLIKSNK